LAQVWGTLRALAGVAGGPMWTAALAVAVLRASGARLNTGVGIHDDAAGSVLTGTQLRVNGVTLGPLSDLQMAEEELERLYAGDVSVHGSRAELTGDCTPDCSNCILDARHDPKTGLPLPIAAPDFAHGNMTDDEQCCIGLPVAKESGGCGRCSEIIPESFYNALARPQVTGTWRVTRCENNEEGGKCDPCKPDRSTDYGGAEDVYCEESEDTGRLMCYPRTPEEYMIQCNPIFANAWYGGWDLQALLASTDGKFRPCSQR